MRINVDTVILGDKVILIPYEDIHVEKYHSWMQSQEIQTLTASEPLTIEAEYEMQKSWREDDDKLTFIIADKQMWDDYVFEPNKSSQDATSSNRLTPVEDHIKIDQASQREIQCIIGDVNLFLNCDPGKKSAEIEIMIAESNARKRGFATEALRLMIAYALHYLNITNFIAKIGCDNIPSIKLFKEKFGFSEISRSEVFKEITLSKRIDPEYTSNGKNIENFHIQKFSNLLFSYKKFRVK
ncbi:N-acetyltransferase 9-like protein [Styela clava]